MEKDLINLIKCIDPKLYQFIIDLADLHGWINIDISGLNFSAIFHKLENGEIILKKVILMLINDTSVKYNENTDWIYNSYINFYGLI